MATWSPADLVTKRCGCGIHTPVCLWRPTVNQVREWEAGVGVEGAPVQLAPRPSLLQAHHVMSHLDGMGNGGRIGVVRQVSREAPYIPMDGCCRPHSVMALPRDFIGTGTWRISIGFPVTSTNGGILGFTRHLYWDCTSSSASL